MNSPLMILGQLLTAVVAVDGVVVVTDFGVDGAGDD